MLTMIAAAIRPPQRLPARLHPDWRALTTPTEPADPFYPDMVEGLPSPARRWLTHALAPGTALRRATVLRQHGMIRLGGWRPFTATQALAPLDGFVWSVTARLLGVAIHGFDRFSDATGEMRHELLGVLPVLTAAGPDVARSAAARLASEIIWAPAAALAPQVGWQAVDDSRVTLLIECGSWHVEPTLTVSSSGALRQVSVPRWTNIGGPWHEEPFTAVCHAERTFGGYTIPARITAGWGFASPRWNNGGAFIRMSIDDATYL